MATIVVEDGSQVSGANSYVSEAELATYAADRGVTASGTAAVLLIQAMDYIESQPFIGKKFTDSQALLWPRYGVYVYGYYVDTDSIPTLLKEAEMEVALGIDAGNNPLASEARMTLREKVGPLDITYSPGSRTATYLKAAETKLEKLVGSGKGINAEVTRG